MYSRSTGEMHSPTVLLVFKQLLGNVHVVELYIAKPLLCITTRYCMHIYTLLLQYLLCRICIVISGLVMFIYLSVHLSHEFSRY